MKFKIIVVSSLLLLVGVVAWSSLRRAQAQATVVPDNRKWDYKVETFTVNNGNQVTDKQTEVINKLANEGWEYVGLLSTGANPYDIHGGGDRRAPDHVTSCGHVLFKRPKV